jgi:hypothetical protein
MDRTKEIKLIAFACRNNTDYNNECIKLLITGFLSFCDNVGSDSNDVYESIEMHYQLYEIIISKYKELIDSERFNSLIKTLFEKIIIYIYDKYAEMDGMKPISVQNIFINLLQSMQKHSLFIKVSSLVFPNGINIYESIIDLIRGRLSMTSSYDYLMLIHDCIKFEPEMLDAFKSVYNRYFNYYYQMTMHHKTNHYYQTYTRWMYHYLYANGTVPFDYYTLWDEMDTDNRKMSTISRFCMWFNDKEFPEHIHNWLFIQSKFGAFLENKEKIITVLMTPFIIDTFKHPFLRDIYTYSKRLVSPYEALIECPLFHTLIIKSCMPAIFNYLITHGYYYLYLVGLIAECRDIDCFEALARVLEKEPGYRRPASDFLAIMPFWNTSKRHQDAVRSILKSTRVPVIRQQFAHLLSFSSLKTICHRSIISHHSCLRVLGISQYLKKYQREESVIRVLLCENTDSSLELLFIEYQRFLVSLGTPHLIKESKYSFS